MNHSLLSHFIGVLLGAAVGERIGSVCEQALLRGLSPFQTMIVLDGGLSNTASETQSLRKFNLAMYGADSLIQGGGLDLADWHQRLEQMNFSPLPTLERLSCGEVAVATLPIALFYHEADGKLRQNLSQVAQQWLKSSESSDGVLIVGTAIAQSLQGALEPATAIAQIVRLLDVSESPFRSQLGQVETLVKAGAGIEQVRAQLVQSDAALSGSIPIAIALYCFLSTQSALQLSG